MNELLTKEYFLNWEEFALCCAAAEIDDICCFDWFDEERSNNESNNYEKNKAETEKGEISSEKLVQTIFNLERRGWLTLEQDTFLLCDDLSKAFYLLRESYMVALVFQREIADPFALLYGNEESFVILQPGQRREEYVGIERYAWEDMPLWLSETGIFQAETKADDLLPAVGYSDEILKKGDLADFFNLNAPENGLEEILDNIPAEIDKYMEFRKLPDGELLARLFVVRQPLFDCFVLCQSGQIQCQTSGLAQIVRNVFEEM